MGHGPSSISLASLDQTILQEVVQLGSFNKSIPLELGVECPNMSNNTTADNGPQLEIKNLRGPRDECNHNPSKSSKLTRKVQEICR